MQKRDRDREGGVKTKQKQPDEVSADEPLGASPEPLTLTFSFRGHRLQECLDFCEDPGQLEPRGGNEPSPSK